MDRAAAEVLQSSPHVQQQMMIMTGNPNYSWWNNSSMRSSIPPILTQELSASPNNFFLAPPNLSPYTPSSSSSSSSSNSSSSSSSNSSLPMSSWFDNHELPPDSWSQLLLGGLVGEEERSTSGMRELFQGKKLENWEEELISQLAPNDSHHVINDHVKQEHYSSRNSYISYNGSHAGGDNDQADFPAAGKLATLSHQVNMSAANSLSPRSCLTNFSNVLDFTNKLDAKHPTPDRSSECNSTATGGAIKKARVQPSSTQRTFKVRKEKLGDRITALHQLVSPFGKTDTASVLLEAIGYIRFLHSQIEALSLPYLGIVRGTDFTHQRSVQGDKKCIFPEDPGQLLNDDCMKIRKGPSDHPGICHEEPKKDLRSRGLCLVPVSCPMQVGNDNGADYWAPPSLGGSGLGGFK